MRPFELTRKAKSDLYAIALYSEQQWGKAQRNLYIKQLDDAFHLIADNPALGKNCDVLLPGYRKFPQGSHVIYYINGSNAAITIIRILHKSMDVEPKVIGD